MSQFRRKLLESYATNKLVYPGLIAAWSAKGKTNEDADRNVLKDLTGNGHDITLNNFAFSGMSGYGGYNFDMTKMWGADLTPNVKKVYKTYATIKTDNLSSGYIHVGRIQANTGLTNLGVNVRFRIRGLKNNQHIRWFYSNISGYTEEEHYFYENGILEIYVPKEITSSGLIDVSFMADKNDNVDVTIELLPEHPDALVFDGVDDYGVNESLPSLTDYTVISKIYWITSPNTSVYAYGKAKDSVPSSIIFSSYSSIGRDECYLYNFGADNNVKSYVNPIINYHNTKVFNGTPINKGYAVDDNYPFYLGGIWANHPGLCNMAFYSFYLFNRTLPPEEIKSFIRKYIDPEYLLPSEIPTPPPSQQGELKYWLCGEDTPVDNKWIDRIDNRMQWGLGSAIYNQEDKYYEFGGLIGKHALINDTNNIFNCGDKFEIEIDFECLPVPDNVQNKAFLLDIGSVTETIKNFGIAIKENKIITNYKMFGNYTNDKYGIGSTQLNNTTIIKEGRQSIYMGVEKHSDTQNIVYVKDSFGNKVYAPNPHTPINHSNFNIKQYFIGDGITFGYSFNTVKIYNIKVYVKSYKETMNFIIIPLADAAEVFTNDELEAARKSIDGKEVIVHEEILLQKKVERGLMTLPTDGEPVVWTYPVYAYNSKELDTLLDSDKWTSKEEIMTVASDNIIEFIPPMKIEEGNVYREDDITYKCIQTSKLPISNKLKDLVNYYVEIVK